MAAVIGVTGGYGTGKSAVCGILREWHVPVFSADDDARRIGDEDPDARREIMRVFGERAYGTKDGTLDRQYVADLVFSDPGKLNLLNGIIHPRVFRSIDAFRESHSSNSHRYLVVESAILFESGLDRKLDYVLAVGASIEHRIERIRTKTGLEEAAIRKRFAAQLPPEEVEKKSDFILSNDDTLDALRVRMRFFHLLFLTLTPRTRIAHDAH